jgi:hypothetical protein
VESGNLYVFDAVVVFVRGADSHWVGLVGMGFGKVKVVEGGM